MYARGGSATTPCQKLAFLARGDSATTSCVQENGSVSAETLTITNRGPGTRKQRNGIAKRNGKTVSIERQGWQATHGHHDLLRPELVLPIEAVAPRSVWRQKTSRAPTSRELFRPKPAGTPAELPTAPSRACLLFVSGRSLVGALVGGQLLLNYYRFCTSSIVLSKVQNESYLSNA